MEPINATLAAPFAAPGAQLYPAAGGGYYFTFPLPEGGYGRGWVDEEQAAACGLTRMKDDAE